jgi:hypothetical protein
VTPAGGDRRSIGRAFGRVAALVLCATGAAWSVAGAQAGNTAEAALTRALDLEGENKCREAIPLYRQAIAMGIPDPVGAVLGLERCYSMTGRPDSLVSLVDSLLKGRPRDPTLRTVQIRTLSTMRSDAPLASAFAEWISLVPQEATPYRVYASVLLEQGRALAADTVLREAGRALGSTRELASEFAQMQTVLGLWGPAAVSWRQAAELLSYLEQAAVFSLMPVPDSLRDSVRAVFAASPVTLSARRVLAGLELKWHAPQAAWRVLSEVPPTDSVVQAWVSFARDAEGDEEWLTARDAYVRAFAVRPRDDALAIRGAAASLSGGDANSALQLLAGVAGDSASRATVTVLRVRALGALGRVREAQQLLTERQGDLDPGAVQLAHRSLAWAWIRVGDLVRARRSLEVAGADTEEGERVSAWIALYEGNLRTARRGLRRTDEPSHDVVAAMALLSRTRSDSSPEIGTAFLTLARGDTSKAAHLFAEVAVHVQDASSFLLGTAARLFVASRDTARAIDLWQLVLDKHAEAPEAAEADLAWARVLLARRNLAGATARLEHLILTWPGSALVPQARRELERARGGVPPGPASGAGGPGIPAGAAVDTFETGLGGNACAGRDA